MLLRGKEAYAVGGYLTNLYHDKEVNRRFREVVEEFGKDHILGMLNRVSCGRDEKAYLRWKIASL